MKSNPFELEATIQSLIEESFVDRHDLEVGKYVSEMEQKKFHFPLPYGLNYCKQHVLYDPVDIASPQP